MTPQDYDIITRIAVMLITGGAIYGAIRTDLKSLHEQVQRALHDVEKLRENLTRHVERFHTNHNGGPEL